MRRRHERPSVPSEVTQTVKFLCLLLAMGIGVLYLTVALL